MDGRCDEDGKASTILVPLHIHFPLHPRSKAPALGSPAVEALLRDRRDEHQLSLSPSESLTTLRS